jgi:hypothetical protein
VSDGLVLWLDADYAPSLKTGTGVRYWADRSGAYRDVFQATAAAQPRLVTGALGSKNAVRFDGVDDSISAAEAFSLPTFEGFVVWQSSIAPGTEKTSILINGRNFEVNHGHSVGARNALSVCAGSACVNDQGWFNDRFVPAPVADTEYLWDFGFDTATASLFVRAQGSAPVITLAGVDPLTTAANPISVGGDPVQCSDHAGCHFLGDVAEVLLYDRVLSVDDRVLIDEYLRNKWSVVSPVCDADEQLGPNGSCYFVDTTLATFAAARSACQARGTGWDLTTLRRSEDHDFVASLVSGDAWIGATDAGVEGTWVWVTDGLEFWSGDSTGSAVGGAYSNWGAADPTGGTSQNCGRYAASEDAWADGDCATTLASVCEGPAN